MTVYRIVLMVVDAEEQGSGSICDELTSLSCAPAVHSVESREIEELAIPELNSSNERVWKAAFERMFTHGM